MVASTLIILPGLDGGDAIVAKASGESYLTHRVSSGQLAAQNLSDVHIILPGQLVRVFETELPKAGFAQQLKMARFAHEDDIANAAEDLHFALSDAQPPRMAVIDRDVMGRLLDTLGALKPKAVYADFDLLSGETALRVIDRAVEPGQAAIDLEWTEENLREPSDVDLANMFAEGIAAGQGLNLLQGEYRARSDFNLPRMALIRFGGLAAAALAAFFVWTGVQDRAAAAQAKELRAETAAEYLALTGDRAPSHPGRETAKLVQSGPAVPTGFLDLSSVLFSGLSGLDNIRVDQLRYNADDGTLRLRLIYPSFDAATQAELAVSRAGGVLTTGGVREQDGAFIGDATLSLGAAS